VGVHICFAAGKKPAFGLLNGAAAETWVAIPTFRWTALKGRDIRNFAEMLSTEKICVSVSKMQKKG
jgi:hypothetical protein